MRDLASIFDTGRLIKRYGFEVKQRDSLESIKTVRWEHQRLAYLPQFD